MTKSIAVLVIMAILIVAISTASSVFVNDVAKRFEPQLNKAMKNPEEALIREIYNDWDKEKKTLLYIMNHRDIEEVSESLVRSYRESASKRFDVALEELSVAKFKLKELVEREKFSLENIL